VNADSAVMLMQHKGDGLPSASSAYHSWEMALKVSLYASFDNKQKQEGNWRTEGNLMA
jgi:hypothetical protein